MSDEQTPQPPEGYELVTEGESRVGDLVYCYEHGWEECDDHHVFVGGFHGLARRVSDPSEGRDGECLGGLGLGAGMGHLPPGFQQHGLLIMLVAPGGAAGLIRSLRSRITRGYARVR